MTGVDINGSPLLFKTRRAAEPTFEPSALRSADEAVAGTAENSLCEIQCEVVNGPEVVTDKADV